MVDALCWDDLDAFGTELDDPLAELLQDLFHRLIETPGSNLDDPDRGYGLPDLLSSGALPGEITTSIQHGIETELRKDDRVYSVAALVQETSKGEYSISIDIVADEEKLQLLLVASGTNVRRVA